MIIKSLSRKSNTNQLVNYIFKYVFRDQEKESKRLKIEQSKDPQGKFIIRHNIRSRSIKGFIKEFTENEKYRLVHRKDSVKLFHDIISFSNKDKEHINDKLLKNIGKKFIEERGLANLYVATKHEDKNHIHLHFAISGTQLNGRSSRVSKQKFHSIKLALQQYQLEKYPKELANSLPEHGKRRRLTKEAIVQRIKNERQTDKQSLLKILEQKFTTATSRDHFLTEIKMLGHEPYFRNGKLQGVVFEGKTKYRFSRLGFDETRFNELDKSKNVVSELQQLRRSRSTQLQQELPIPSSEKGAADSKGIQEQEMLDELSDLRNRGRNKDELEIKLR